MRSQYEPGISSVGPPRASPASSNSSRAIPAGRRHRRRAGEPPRGHERRAAWRTTDAPGVRGGPCGGSPVDVGEHDMGAQGDQPGAEGHADARAAAGDDRRTALEGGALGHVSMSTPQVSRIQVAPRPSVSPMTAHHWSHPSSATTVEVARSLVDLPRHGHQRQRCESRGSGTSSTATVRRHDPHPSDAGCQGARPGERIAPGMGTMTRTEQGPGLVTVVFVDVEGSTALVDRVGDEAGTTVARTARRRARADRALRRTRGEVARRRADADVRLARGWRWRSRWRPSGRWPVRRRGCGSASTPARCSTLAGDPMGGAVNAAARIADRATAARCWCRRWCASSSARCRRSFVDRGRCRLKGFPDRWHLYAAVDRPVEPGRARSTIGRVEELVADRSARSLGCRAGAGGSSCSRARRASARPISLRRRRRRRPTTARSGVLEARTDELERRPAAIVHGLLDGMHRARHRAAPPGRAARRSARRVATASTWATPSSRRPSTWSSPSRGRSGRSLVARGPALGGRALAAGRRRARPPSRRVADQRRRARAGRCPVRRCSTGSSSSSPRPADAHLAGALDEIDVLRAGQRPDRRRRRRRRCVPGSRTTAGNPLYVTELLRSLDEDGLLRVEAGVARRHRGRPARRPAHDVGPATLMVAAPRSSSCSGWPASSAARFTLARPRDGHRSQHRRRRRRGSRTRPRPALVIGDGDRLSSVTTSSARRSTPTWLPPSAATCTAPPARRSPPTAPR